MSLSQDTALHTSGMTLAMQSVRDTVVLEAEGRCLVPGLWTGTCMSNPELLTVTEFVRAVLPHGTTGMFIDPHEIANVLGLRGVRLMVDEAWRATHPRLCPGAKLCAVRPGA